MAELNEKNDGKMKKLISLLTALALSMAAVSVNPAYGYDTTYNANDPKIGGKWWENIPPLGFPGPDVIRVHVDLSLSRAPLLGQSTEAEVTIKLNSKMVESLGGFTEAVIVLPEGFALVSGATSWRGYVPKGGSIKFNAILQSVKTGDWKIEAFARYGSDGYWEYGRDQIYVSVSETATMMRKTEKPYVDNYDNTEHPIQTQHGEGLIPEKMTAEYLKDTSDGVSPLTIYTVTISATLHITVDGVLYPRRMVKVEIWDSDTFPDLDDHLGTTYTRDNGYFEITVSHGDPNGIDIYWKCFLDSPSDRGVRVEKPGFFGPTTYRYVSPIWPNLQDGSYYLDHWTISGGAPNIYHQITNAWYYLAGEVGYQTPKVTTQWPSGLYPVYDDGANKIHLPAGWEYENYATVHEYGHHVMNAVYGYIPYGPRAETWFEEDGSSPEIAWAEGWANFFPLLIMNTDTLIVAQSHGVWWFPITVNFETRWNSQGIPWDSGDNVEANVTAALWDLYDSADDGYDSYDGGFSSIWDTISSQTDDTYEEFYYAWVARGHSQKGFLYTAYQNTINYSLLLPMAEFSLVTLYEVSLDLDIFLEKGSKLIVKFYTWGDAFQAEKVVWSGFMPAHVVLLQNIPHPEGKPVERVELVLTDFFGNVISTIASFTVTRDDLFGRIMEIKGIWPFASPDEQDDLFQEIMDIKGIWPFAPTNLVAGTVAGTRLAGTGLEEPAVIYHQGGNTIEVESGQTFVLRHRLRWGEPDPGFYGISIYWDSPDNNPAENFTFLYTSAYFDNDGDNLPDPGVAMIENLVRFSEGPSPDDPTRTRYVVVVYSRGDARNGIFNVDVWLRAAGWEENHSPTENHPIYYSGTIDVWEATTLSVSAPPITIRVPASDISISPEYQSGLAGAMLNYAVTVKNTSGDVDSYNLSVSDNSGWALTLSENRLENVPPGESRSVTLSVTIPDNALDATDNITVTATSAANPEVRASNTCVARAIEVKTAIFYPSDDTNAYERFPDSNYGSRTSIWVSPYDARKNRGFLKFDLSGLPSGAWVTGAKLRLYCWKKEYDDFDAAVYEVANDGWSEYTLTWNNQPSYGGRLYTVRITSVGWYTWEVRSFIDKELKGDKIASLSIKGAVEPHGGRARFDSKEWRNSGTHPYLEITYTSPSGEWTGEWTERADTPNVGGYGEAVVGTGSYIYIAKTLYATSTPQFWRYDPTANSWTNMSITGLPTGAFRNGTALEWDNADYIYALAGARYSDADRRLFFRYTISGDSWTQMADTPGPQGAGDAITWSGYDGYVYALIGSSGHGTMFARYKPASNNWEVRASPLAGVEDGASLVWTGGAYLYALRGEYLETTPLQDFWRYDIVSDSWTTVTPIPEDGGVGDGGSLLWIGNWLPAHADYIYTLGGGDSWENPGDNFYRYIISANTWEKLTSIPYPIGYYNGNRLGFADGHIYYWQGTPSEFYGGGRKFYVFEFPA